MKQQLAHTGWPEYMKIMDMKPQTSNEPQSVPAAEQPYRTSIRELSQFLVPYCAVQLGAGGQTLRVMRTAERIAGAYGCSVQLALFPRHIMMNVADATNESSWKASVGTVRPGPPDVRLLSALTDLSWKAHEGRLSFTALRESFHAEISRKRIAPGVLLCSAACANAALCRLFGGDCFAVLLVAVTTLMGFSLRQWLTRRNLGEHMTVFVCALTASMAAAGGCLAGFTSTPQVALGSCVLFLVPGLPLINAVMDVLTGYPLMAFARFVRAGLLISCIALGLAGTLFCTGLDMSGVSLTSTHFGLLIDIFVDGLVAAVAAMGFAVVSNPSVRVLLTAGCLAALGHALRFFLLHQQLLGITPASFVAALTIGVISIIVAHRTRIAAEFYSFLALLPMIPGMYAYDAILSLMRFMSEDPAAAGIYLTMFFKSALTVLFVVIAMAIGVTAPLFLQRRLWPEQH